MSLRIASVFVSALMALVCRSTPSCAEQRFPHRWIRASLNLQVDSQAETAVALIRRAQQAGYTGLLINDAKFGRVCESRPTQFYTNVGRVRGAAELAGIELIPLVMPIGYSNPIVSCNPNLAEGIPVRDCEFLVNGGEARVANDREFVPSGGFEEFAGDRPAGWDFVDGPGRWTHRDTEMFHSGKASLRMDPAPDNPSGDLRRVLAGLALKPWHQYHVSVWIKTDTIQRPENVRLLLHADDVDRRVRLNLRPIDVQGTQDWTQHDVVFNTFDQANVRLYIGGWNPGNGTIWLDDVSVRETAGVNMLRREGCPVRVTSNDGTVEYVEGTDFERWEDPLMGGIPYPGRYTVWHEPPPIILTDDSRIRDGERLRVSFYHTRIIKGGLVCCCLNNEELDQYLRQHIEFVDALLKPKRYFMSMDEVRLVGWCGLCDDPQTTSGELLANCVRRCTQIVRDVSPDAELYVWSDMFDPHHNAVDHYWLTRGTMRGSWEGLGQDVGIGNWNSGSRQQSLRFFAGRGHPQIIAGYYDRPNVAEHLHAWLDAAQPFPNVDGVIYTTWKNDFRQLETFMDALNDWEERHR